MKSKRWFVVFLVLLVLGILTKISLTGKHAMQMAQRVDVGLVQDQDNISHTFKIFNYTWHEIGVLGSSTACDCTIVDDLPDHVAPFSTLEIPVSVDLRSKTGHFTSPVAIEFSNSAIATLSLKGTVLRSYPNEISFGRVLKGNRTVRFAVPVSGKVEPIDVFSDDIFVASLAYSKELGTNVIRFEFKEDATEGPFDRYLSLPLARYSLPEKQVHVTGLVRPDLEASERD